MTDSTNPRLSALLATMDAYREELAESNERHRAVNDRLARSLRARGSESVPPPAVRTGRDWP